MSEVLYIGTNSGVVVAERTPATKFEVRNLALRDWAVLALTRSVSDPEVVYAGTRGDGVWATADGGKTWNKPSSGRMGPGKVRALAVHPDGPGGTERLLAGCEPISVFASDDGATSWHELASVRDCPWVADVTYPVPSVEPHVRDVACFGSQIYLALQVGAMLQSNDDGEHWAVMSDGFDSDVHTMSIDPTASERIVISTGGHDFRHHKIEGRALYRTDTAGDGWEAVATDLAQDYGLPLLRHAVQPEYLVAAVARGVRPHWDRPEGADAKLLRSRDGGATWANVDIDRLSGDGRHMVVGLSGDEGRPDQLFGILSSGKVIESSDFGDSWADVGLDLDVGECQSLLAVSS